MSLDTVLKIGKVLRNSNNSLKHFKYVQPCPRDKKGNYPLCLSFKVNDDFSIDFNSVFNFIYYITNIEVKIGEVSLIGIVIISRR